MVINYFSHLQFNCIAIDKDIKDEILLKSKFRKKKLGFHFLDCNGFNML